MVLNIIGLLMLTFLLSDFFLRYQVCHSHVTSCAIRKSYHPENGAGVYGGNIPCETKSSTLVHRPRCGGILNQVSQK